MIPLAVYLFIYLFIYLWRIRGLFDSSVVITNDFMCHCVCLCVNVFVCEHLVFVCERVFPE